MWSQHHGLGPRTSLETVNCSLDLGLEVYSLGSWFHVLGLQLTYFVSGIL